MTARNTPELPSASPPGAAGKPCSSPDPLPVGSADAQGTPGGDTSPAPPGLTSALAGAPEGCASASAGLDPGGRVADGDPARPPGTKPPRICGLDLSLTSTGFARVCGGDVAIERLQPGKLTGHERLEWLAQTIGARCSDADLVVIEGPSFGSVTGKQHERGGLWWLIAHALWWRKVPYAVVPPPVLKRYACGRGNADKDQVLASVIRRYPDVPVGGNDTADALVLAAMGARHLGVPLEASLPANHLEAMTKVNWPVTP